MDAANNAKEDDSLAKYWRSFTISKMSLGQERTLRESPGSLDTPTHVLVVQNALEEFIMDLVEWVLKNIAFQTSCKITILGVQPYLNIPQLTKTSDIWAMNIEDLMATTEWRSNTVKYQKVHRLIDLCLKYGVVPQIRHKMGYPVEEEVVKQITLLQPTLVVFDRIHRKHREYYAEKVSCKMVMMRDDGEVDLIRGNRSSLIDHGESTVKEPPASTSLPTTKLILTGHIKKILKQKSEKSHAESSRKTCSTEKSHAESSRKTFSTEKSHADSSRKTCSTKESVVKVRTNKRENAGSPQPSCGNNVKSWNCTQTATLSPLY